MSDVLSYDRDDPSIDPKSFWTATLSDGNIIYEDIRPGQETAWTRMRKYLLNNKDVKIREMSLTFHNEGVTIKRNHPNDFDGFFFSNQVVAILGGKQKLIRRLGLVKGSTAYVICISDDGEKNEEVVQCLENDPRVIF